MHRASDRGSLSVAHLELIQRSDTVGMVDRDELKAQIDELMRQYQEEEIDGDIYAQRMMELTASAQE